jgi:hypothetical protein
MFGKVKERESSQPEHVENGPIAPSNKPRVVSYAEIVRYSSDESSSDSESKTDSDIDETPSNHMSQCLAAALPRKRQRREVPYRTKRIEKRKRHQAEFMDALKDLQKLLKSKKTCFVAGPNVLQAHRTAAMETYLRLVIANG